MSSKLDQSLDEILAERPRVGAAGRRGARSGNAPAGGIRKRPQRAAAQKASATITQNATKTVPTGPSGKVAGSKIIVSNLPYDVDEAMIKEYFTKVVGPIKRCVITYGPNGQSRGIATVEFSRASDAATAVQKYNGVEVDKRPMKVELVVDPTAPASFADRIGAPKQVPVARNSTANKPKPVTKNMGTSAARGAKGRRGGRDARGGRSGNPSRKKPTAEELDADMADYFVGGTSGAATAGGAAPTAVGASNGDVGMDDDVL
ncbi:RNA-binding domain-containing protein [Morchella conica CCBAS932]|uniref:RNA-binding domain-containing protein n=2 Tax=Morchella sect. Distantes TaxID=1051054 RepID=A0A3N4KL98_9PEZI|nr:RNA-binding domain-containing protein [Morchella conica CCBAS932]